MNTFVPLPNVVAALESLDNKRLGKQRVETYQILRAIHKLSNGWRNHPCTLMWAENVDALVYYGLCSCEVWMQRGFNDSLFGKIATFKNRKLFRLSAAPLPWWWNGPIHRSHRSNLLRKDYGYYSQFKWKEPDNLEYVWPKRK